MTMDIFLRDDEIVSYPHVWITAENYFIHTYEFEQKRKKGKYTFKLHRKEDEELPHKTQRGHILIN